MILKISVRLPFPTALASLVLCMFAIASTSAAEENEAVGSIRPAGSVSKTELPTLAKISFDEAYQAALAAVPGCVVVAELEIEHGNLMYSFEIVTGDKILKEVEIDAGNGRVLAVEGD